MADHHNGNGLKSIINHTNMGRYEEILGKMNMNYENFVKEQNEQIKNIENVKKKMDKKEGRIRIGKLLVDYQTIEEEKYRIALGQDYFLETTGDRIFGILDRRIDKIKRSIVEVEKGQNNLESRKKFLKKELEKVGEENQILFEEDDFPAVRIPEDEIINQRNEMLKVQQETIESFRKENCKKLQESVPKKMKNVNFHENLISDIIPIFAHPGEIGRKKKKKSCIRPSLSALKTLDINDFSEELVQKNTRTNSGQVDKKTQFTFPQFANKYTSFRSLENLRSKLDRTVLQKPTSTSAVTDTIKERSGDENLNGNYSTINQNRPNQPPKRFPIKSSRENELFN
ncbi:hypothetical protein SNEBB_001704 [Seison nebaliae]|nr:hypothetical protein SNEBB_001704 [Seison nebaliae]